MEKGKKINLISHTPMENDDIGRNRAIEILPHFDGLTIRQLETCLEEVKKLMTTNVAVTLQYLSEK